MRLGARLRGEDTGGNSYLASVSDLVSALIFVFIIMLAVFAYRLAEVTEDWTSTYETRGRILEDIAVTARRSRHPRRGPCGSGSAASFRQRNQLSLRG